MRRQSCVLYRTEQVPLLNKSEREKNLLFVLDSYGYISEKIITMQIKVHISVPKVFFIVNPEKKNYYCRLATILRGTSHHISTFLTSRDLVD